MIPKNSSTVAQLKLTCKTHKPHGSVKFRAIHASSQYLLAGLGSWVAKKCISQLENAKFMIPDTRQFVKEISRIKPKSSHRFVKLDIAQILLSGTLPELVRDATTSLQGSERDLTRKVLEYLRWEQYVESRWLPGRLFRTVVGTGMGLVHSGEVADAAYYHRVEKGRMDDESYMQQFSIDGYWRFKDGALILVNDMNLAKQFIWETMERAGYFKLECEGVSSTNMQFYGSNDYQHW